MVKTNEKTEMRPVMNYGRTMGKFLIRRRHDKGFHNALLLITWGLPKTVHFVIFQ